MDPISKERYIERKLYANAARDWCRSLEENRTDIEINEADCRGDTLVRCFIQSIGALDIIIGYDGVTAQCDNITRSLASFPSERFDQLVFQSRLDALLSDIAAGTASPNQKDALLEGARMEVTLDRYERNNVARQACLAARGTICAICGFDFAHAYGPQFAGIIQVHHIVPLHVSAGEHVVDPTKDLIPVCPNCHVALHSKPGGVYLPEELRALMR